MLRPVPFFPLKIVFQHCKLRAKKELKNCHRILSRWCEDTTGKGINLDVGGISAEKLLSFIGEASPLKVWQVERIVDKVTAALEPSA